MHTGSFLNFVEIKYFSQPPGMYKGTQFLRLYLKEPEVLNDMNVPHAENFLAKSKNVKNRTPCPSKRLIYGLSKVAYPSNRRRLRGAAYKVFSGRMDLDPALFSASAARL